MSLEVWRRNSQLLYYYDICCYQFGAWQNCASRETKPGEASYRPLVMDSVLQWLLCLILPLTILISLKLCQSFVLSLGSKREKSLATPMFQVLLCGCATQSGMQEGGLETINMLENCYKSLPLFERCQCSLDVHLWSFVSPRLQVQMKLVFLFFLSTSFGCLLSILESFIINKAWQLHQILQRHQILEVACNG
jgi:hypothetical protein